MEQNNIQYNNTTNANIPVEIGNSYQNLTEFNNNAINNNNYINYNNINNNNNFNYNNINDNFNNNNINDNFNNNNINNNFNNNNILNKPLNDKNACKEKCPSCFCPIRVVFCVNCLDKEEMLRYHEKPTKDCCIVCVIFYYFAFFITQLFYCAYLLVFKEVVLFIKECCCCCLKKNDDKNIQIINKQETINNQNVKIEKKIKDFEVLDKTNNFGNTLNNPRVREYQDKNRQRDFYNLKK